MLRKLKSMVGYRMLFVGVILLCGRDALAETHYYHSCEYKDRQTEVEILSCNLFHEARSHKEGVVGLYAVAFTTINRVRSSRFPDTLQGVVYAPYAFSWTGDDKSDRVYDKESWRRCKDIARRVLSITERDYQFYDITKGALFYHANYVSPNWANKDNITVVINNHVFYHVDIKK